jgi:hypothetical protein
VGRPVFRVTARPARAAWCPAAGVRFGAMTESGCKAYARRQLAAPLCNG